MKLKVKELERQERTDAQMTIGKLSISLQSDPSAKGGVIMTGDNKLAILYYQSGLMGEWFNKFPEILMIDGTYCVNKAGMPLYALMVEDGHGHHQVVRYAATSSEDSNHINSILQSFKDCNPSWSKVSIITINKDFTEWEIFEG